MSKGTYVLKIYLSKDITVDVGSLGIIQFESGWYAYVGSSRSTDFKRIERHINVNNGENDTRHWHIDYLIGNGNSEIVGSYQNKSPIECPVAQNIELPKIEDFGCSDCDCDSHLYYTKSDIDENITDSFSQLSEEFSYEEYS